jgi:purine-nucleoside phosphorylase
MQRLGWRSLIVTNAAGAIDRSFEPGDLMLIRDHVNLMGMAGLSPSAARTWMISGASRHEPGV